MKTMKDTYCPKNKDKLTKEWVDQLSDDDVHQQFITWRWGSWESVCCPKCSHIGVPFRIKSRQQLRCKQCSHTFSVTSGTALAFRKLPLRQLMKAMVDFINSPKGISSYKLANGIAITQKSALILLHKFREGLMNRQREMINTTVHLDCCVVPTFTQKKKTVYSDKGYETKTETVYKKSCLFVMVAKNSKQRCTYPFILSGEKRAEIEPLVNKLIAPNTTVCTDGFTSYQFLNKSYVHKKMTHKAGIPTKKREFYVANNNLFAEYYFGNFKRSLMGEWHFLSETYLALYANEIAFRNDMSKLLRKDVANKAWELILSQRNSSFRGYWQRNKPNLQKLDNQICCACTFAANQEFAYAA